MKNSETQEKFRALKKTDSLCISFIGSYLLPQEAQARLFLKILDIDECAERQSDCHANATCKNSVSSFACSCNSASIGALVNVGTCYRFIYLSRL